MTSRIPIPSRARPRLAAVLALCCAYLAICVAALLVAFLLRSDDALVTDTVWIRGGIVTASAVLTVLLAFWSLRGSRGAFRRLRLVSALMVVAIAVIVAIPGFLPLWMRAEQALCGAVLLAVVALVNGGLRGMLAPPRAGTSVPATSVTR